MYMQTLPHRIAFASNEAHVAGSEAALRSLIHTVFILGMRMHIRELPGPPTFRIEPMRFLPLGG